jgi:hypothetical protein
MALVDAFRSGLAALQRTLRAGGFELTVQHEAYLGLGNDGQETYAAAVTLPAVLFDKVVTRQQEGRWVSVTIPVLLIVGARAVGLRVRDRFTLPDGREVIATAVDGAVLPESGERLAAEVSCG